MIGPGADALFPASLDLQGRLVVVIGGGQEAEEHTRTFLAHGADVLLVAPMLTTGLEAMVAEGRVEHEQRAYVRGDLAGAFLAVCAEECAEVARAVYQEAEGSGCLVNIIDAPALSSFTFGCRAAASPARA